ncbi:MAG: branched-chain amino acid ABC transporter permease [Vallitalea sp.]|nr:branched-chain amino acid ABC transporter permease [Vallitalea sp.]
MNMKKTLNNYAVNLICVVSIYLIIYILIKNGVINSYYESVIIFICINIILATSLNLTTGFLGQLALGHAGFVAVGAYTSALFTKTVKLPFLEFPIALLIGGIVAAIFGIAIGIPALRLRGDYLAIITLAFSEMIRVFIVNSKFTGGARGLSGIPFLSNFTNVFFITVIIITILFLLIRSRHGRAMISIREDEIASEAMGISSTYYKILGFTISAFFAGIGGGIFAHYITMLEARKFNFMYSVEILIIVVFGGMGSFTGSIIAAIVLTIFNEALRDFSIYRIIAYSILLVIIMIFKPGGLLGRYEFSISRVFNKIRFNK